MVGNLGKPSKRGYLKNINGVELQKQFVGYMKSSFKCGEYQIHRH